MQEVDINTLVDKYNNLKENIPNDIIIVGKIDKLYIYHKYNQLDLSRIECNQISYSSQEGETIKNHILPNSLIILYCPYNKLTSLPKLPSSLEILSCWNNKLTSLPKLPSSLKKLCCENNELTSFTNVQLPNSLKYLSCYNNELTSFTDVQLPDSLEYLDCSNNHLTSFTDVQLPISLKYLYCSNNQLTTLPDFTHIDHEIELSFIQDEPIEYIPYNKNIQLCNKEDTKIIIEGYPHNPITNQRELDQYMKYIKNYQLNRIKSARK